MKMILGVFASIPVFGIYAMRKNNSPVRFCLFLVWLSLILSGPAGVFGNWGMEVGRADAGDVTSLAGDWNSFKKERARLDRLGLKSMVAIERQRQLLGVAAEDWTPQQIFEEVQDLWLNNVMGPLQRIALNPAASCAEAQFALTAMTGMRRQQQLLGLEESASISRVYQATEEMASLRCRDEALDECVATGRFRQILDLMVGVERQRQLLGREGDLESWAEDALKQCAIYELHFVSRTKGGHAAMGVETVRDGKVQIRFESPAGGLKQALSRPLGEALKGETAGGNNPFFVSIKCTPPVIIMEFTCSPGADSKPIKVRINDFDLKHREFYIDYVKDKDWLTESEFSKQRLVGQDKMSFEFEGGMFSLQGLIKAGLINTLSVPMPDWGNTFYMAHKKDQIGPPSARLKIESINRGVHPAVFQFTYADQGTYLDALTTDSTEFELIHKPEPKPFRKLPEPIRKPLRPMPNQ